MGWRKQELQQERQAVERTSFLEKEAKTSANSL
jgi:hypothetical protein